MGTKGFSFPCFIILLNLAIFTIAILTGKKRCKYYGKMVKFHIKVTLTLSPAGLQSSFSSFLKKIIRIQDFKKMHSNH